MERTNTPVEGGETSSPVEKEQGTDGEPKVGVFHDPSKGPHNPVPKRVALVAMGRSHHDYSSECLVNGSPYGRYDEVWGINAAGMTFRCDRVFIMDAPVFIEQRFRGGNPVPSDELYLKFMKNPLNRVITTFPHPDYPSTLAYPLREVVNRTRYTYYNTAVPYAISYAAWLGVKSLTIFGADYTYPDAHVAESGRACAEWAIQNAMMLGVEITIARSSTLLDTHQGPRARFYGYPEGVEFDVTEKEDGEILISAWRPGEKDTLGVPIGPPQGGLGNDPETI